MFFLIGYNLDAHNPYTPHSHHVYIMRARTHVKKRLRDSLAYGARETHVCILLFLDFDTEETCRFDENENMVAKMPKVSAL